MQLHHFMDKKALTSWGWRIPFLAGAVVASVGFFVRTTESAKEAHRAQAAAAAKYCQTGQSSRSILLQVSGSRGSSSSGMWNIEYGLKAGRGVSSSITSSTFSITRSKTRVASFRTSIHPWGGTGLSFC